MLARASLIALVAACARPAPPSPPAPPAPQHQPDASIAIVEPADASVAEAQSTPPDASPPRDVRPPFAPPDEGQWTPVALPNEGDEGPALYRRLLRPDTARPSTDLYVVAIDLSRVSLRAVAGVSEPSPKTKSSAATKTPRPAIIPAADHASLLAAFNGGWKSEHGNYGMKVDGAVLVAASEGNCTVAGYDDETLRIGPWKALAPDEPRMRFFRQTPPCLYTGGVRHAGLKYEMTTSWGASETGDPLIRRSAIGLDEARKVLFFGLGNQLTARALADGMHHAGATDIAELDVNWSYPKLLVYRPTDAGVLEASSLFPGFKCDKAEYVRRRSDRDFFYLVRRPSAP